MWALHVVGVVARRRRRKVGRVASCSHVGVVLLRQADGTDEVFVLLAPVGLCCRGRGRAASFATGARRSSSSRCDHHFQIRLRLSALHSHLRWVKYFPLFGRRLLADRLVLLDAVRGEVAAALRAGDGA